MRKVLFKMWVPAEWPEGTNSANQRSVCPLPGTGCWEKDFKHEGVFHQWGNAYTEFETGAGNYTVALVETPNGEISEVLPSNIRFIELNKVMKAPGPKTCNKARYKGHELYLTRGKEYDIIHNPYRIRSKHRDYNNSVEFAVIDNNGKRRFYKYGSPVFDLILTE